MISPIRLVDKKETKTNRYESLGFYRNPFPRNPSITINSSDDRENGTIYIPDLRHDEINTFKSIVVPQKDGHETKNIAFLMDHATRQGRGIGKTSFLNYQLKNINKDFGDELSNGGEVLFAVYCSPQPGENYKKFWSLSRLVIRSIIEQSILGKALCRLKIIKGLMPEELLSEISDDNLLETVGNREWIRSKVAEKNLLDTHSEMHITSSFKRTLESLGIDADLSEKLAKFGSSSSDFLKYYFDTLTESNWRKSANRLLFDSFTSIFTEAGFTKGIILFDELEKIVQPQNSQDRRIFCDELRYWFIDGDNANSQNSFFNILLVIHPYIQELLNPHWSASGLERFSSLGGQFDSQSTIFFSPIKEEQAIPLAIEYLKASRSESTDEKPLILPFSEETLQSSLTKSQNVPGKFLSFLHQLIEKAVDEKWSTITVQHVNDLFIANQSSTGSESNDNAEMEANLGQTKVTI